MGHRIWSVVPILLMELFTPSLFATGSELLTYEEVSSGYDQNIASLLPLAVEWTVTERELMGSIEWDVLSARMLKDSVDAPGFPGTDEEKEELKRQQLQSVRNTNDEAIQRRLKPTERRSFFWTDRRQFQYRSPKKVDVSISDTHSTSGESLLTNWSNVVVCSFVPDREPKFRAWTGLSRKGTKDLGFGVIASKDLQYMNGTLWCPPLGSVGAVWKKQRRFSSLDTVFGVDVNDGLQSTEVGEPIRGEETILVRYARGGGVGTSVSRLAIWVAHRKGFIPLRVERSFSGGPLTLEATKEFPSRLKLTIEVDGIDKIGAGFYPRKIVTTRFEAEPKWKYENLGKDPTAEPTVAITMVPATSVEEVILKVEPGRILSDESMAAAFPIGTRYEDLDTKQWYLEGTAKEDFDRQLVAELTKGMDSPKLPSEPLEKRSRFGVFLWINVGAILLLAIVVVTLRSRAKS